MLEIINVPGIIEIVLLDTHQDYLYAGITTVEYRQEEGRNKGPANNENFYAGRGLSKRKYIDETMMIEIS